MTLNYDLVFSFQGEKGEEGTSGENYLELRKKRKHSSLLDMFGKEGLEFCLYSLPPNASKELEYLVGFNVYFQFIFILKFS